MVVCLLFEGRSLSNLAELVSELASTEQNTLLDSISELRSNTRAEFAPLIYQ